MLVDGLADVGRVSFFPGVEAAHAALEAGELLDHFGQEIGLAEGGGLHGGGLGLRDAELVAKVAHCLFQPQRLVLVSAELLLEEDVLQAVRPLA